MASGAHWREASGRREAVAATLAGDDTAFAAYSERVFAGYARYLWARHAYYADEQRWPDSPFWRRRHAASSAPADKTRGL